MTEPTMIDYGALAAQLNSAAGDTIYDVAVNAPFDDKLTAAFLFLGFITLYMVGKTTHTLQLVAASGTEQYRLAIEKFAFKPEDYHLHLGQDRSNTLVQAILTNQHQSTIDWATLSRDGTPAEVAKLNQANSGIAFSDAYPLQPANTRCLMFNFYQYQEQIGEEQRTFMEHYVGLVSARLTKHASDIV